MSCVTVIIARSTHPLRPVAVTVYVPGSVMTSSSSLPRSFPSASVHSSVYGGCPPETELCNVTSAVAQSSIPLAVANTTGGSTSWPMVTLAAALTPLAPVAVSVYVPGASTVSDSVSPRLAFSASVHASA